MKEDLETAYHWFTHPNGTVQSHLSSNGNQTIDAIRTALSTHSLEQARQIAFNLTFNPKENALEAGEILIWAAIYALYLEEPDYLPFAKELFQDAAAQYSDEEPHYRAISLWLLGLIYWQFPEYKREALYIWEYSLRVLSYLSYSPESLNPSWYQKIRFRVLEALFHARVFQRHLALRDVKPYRLSVAKKQQPSKEAGHPIGKPKSAKKPLTIHTFPIYQYVPAGGWGVVDPDEIGHSTIEHFIIHGHPYQAIDFMGRGQINIQEQGQYAIVRITGTSMNKLDIQPDDLVLIHRQEQANHTDIVLAARINLDPEATLKRLYWQGSTIELRPESDQAHPALPVDKRDNLKILGIAIAVFKPVLPDQSTSTSSPPERP
jgi:hypothetical protein